MDPELQPAEVDAEVRRLRDALLALYDCQESRCCLCWSCLTTLRQALHLTRLADDGRETWDERRVYRSVDDLRRMNSDRVARWRARQRVARDQAIKVAS